MPSPLGIVLVILQFSTLILLVTTFFWIEFYDNLFGRIVGSMLFVSGLAVIIAGAMAFQTVNKTPMQVTPDPGQEQQLVTVGIWGWVRHPVYCGLLQVALGLCCWHQNWPVFVIWLGLVIIITCKGKYEESMLTKEFLDYAEYKKHSCMLFPLPFYHYRAPATSSPPPAVSPTGV